jgi:Sec-independent protein secretion pathway component TatC
VFPWVWGFFLAFRDDPQVFPLIQSAFSFYAKLLLTCGVALQLPATVLLLARAGAVTSSVLVRNIGYAAVVVVTVAAILTPTHDTVTLLLTALPLFVVYVLCVLIAWGFAGPSLEEPADPSRPRRRSAV